MLRSFRLAAAIALAAPALLLAQKKVAEPPRPQLLASADTNDATAYYDLGVDLVQAGQAQKAADAFYWAARLNPHSADALYGQRVALLLSQPRLLLRYWTGDRSTARNKDVQHADSLYLRALTINPFFYRKLDAALFAGVIQQYAAELAGTSGNRLAVEYEIDSYLRTAPAATRAWRSYTAGDFPTALRLYADAIKQARKKASLRVDRGGLFFQLDQPDSAMKELTLAAEELRKSDKKDLVFVYESKAVVEHGLGLVHDRLGNTEAAREAFGRALQEDLAYAPAHVQLAFLALGAKDTATAVSEFDLAVQISGDDAAMLQNYGFTLHEIGRHAEAEATLRKAIAANPVFAAPHFTLAKSLAAQKRAADAAAEYRAFLTLSSRQDPRRSEAEAQLAALGGGTR